MTTAINEVSTVSNQITSSELEIVPKDAFPALEDYPIDDIDTITYARIERLASWFVLRAPLSELTRLSNPSKICMFTSHKDPKMGSRAENRLQFDQAFLEPLGIDCTQFEFVYTRRAIKPNLIERSLACNSSSVFNSQEERAVCFIGKCEDSSREDSCIESICRHIRNGIAHGRIAVSFLNEEPYLFIEDGSTPRRVNYVGNKPGGQLIEVRFRMLARLSTVERWYQILRSDYHAQ